jgi:hypothetical protein
MALTPDGSTPAGDNVTIFVWALFIVGTIGLFYTFFMLIAKIVTAGETIYDVLLSWGFYILMIMINHLSAHYIEDVFTYNLSNTFLTLTVWTNGVLPLIAFIITFFIKSTQKKKVPSPQELGGFRNG